MEKVVIDKNKCMGCGACAAISDGTNGGNFCFDDDGLCEVVNENVISDDSNNTKKAVDTCPMLAIEIVNDEQ